MNIPDNQSFDPSQYTSDPQMQQQLLALQQQGSNIDHDPETDGTHPLTDKIAQLALALRSGNSGQPQQPNQSNLTGISSQVPGTGLGSAISRLFTGHPLMHPGPVTMGTNAVTDQSQLPNGLQIQPIGTDANGKPVYDMSQVDQQQKALGTLAAFQGRQALTNPSVSPELAQALQSGNQQAVNDQWNKEHPGVPLPLKLLATTTQAKNAASTAERGSAIDKMAGARELMTAYTVGGGPAMQQAAANADKRLGLIQNTQALVNAIDSQGGKATYIQANELGRNMAAIASSGSSVISDHAMDSFIPNSIVKQYGSGISYLTNAQKPVDFSGFMPQFKDLIQRETLQNKQVSDAAADFGIKLSQGINPGVAKPIANARVGNTVFSAAGQPQQTEPGTGIKRRSLSDIFAGK